MTQEIPDVLLGVLQEDDTLESLKAIRDMLARTLDAEQGYCEECGRRGIEPKDVAPLTNRLMDCLARIDALDAPVTSSQPAGNVSSLDVIRSRMERRTGAGTEGQSAPQGVAKRQGGRRPRYKPTGD